MQVIARDEEYKGQASPLEIIARIVHHVRPVLGWRTGLFVGRWVVRLPHYRKRFVRADEDEDLSEIKRSLAGRRLTNALPAGPPRACGERAKGSGLPSETKVTQGSVAPARARASASTRGRGP